VKNRRDFLKTAAAAGAASLISPSLHSVSAATSPVTTPADDRSFWVGTLVRLGAPVLENLARGELKKNMPVEAADPRARRPYTHLEAFARLLVGIAPWLEVKDLQGAEADVQIRFIELTHKSMASAVNPDSPDFLNFNKGGQALVDSAFLAEAVLRAPNVLWEQLDSNVRTQLVTAIKSSRAIGTPSGSNWVMFAAMVETFLLKVGEPTIEERLESCVRNMLGWYVGDGAYGDGEHFHFDYYNAFVIQPMLIDVLDVLRKKDGRFDPAYQIVLRRARRFAAVQERLISPEGTFPPIGRSITYRFGAFQTLAQIALMRELPKEIEPAQVRCAMTAMIRKLIEAPGTFDSAGWLQLGLCGHQPSLAEHYISTGSLYLCSAGLLPLGLPPSDPFWSGPATKWTSQRLWSGESLPADKAMSDDRKRVEIPTLQR
jgi:Uncharacterized protein conserved in bacteria